MYFTMVDQAMYFPFEGTDPPGNHQIPAISSKCRNPKIDRQGKSDSKKMTNSCSCFFLGASQYPHLPVSYQIGNQPIPIR